MPRTLRGLRSQPGRFGQSKVFLPLAGIVLRIIQVVVWSLYPLLTKLYQLLRLNYNMKAGYK